MVGCALSRSMNTITHRHLQMHNVSILAAFSNITYACGKYYHHMKESEQASRQASNTNRTSE